MASPQGPRTPTVNENDESSRDRSAESSNPASREGSRPPKKKHNVRFTAGGESLDTANQKEAFDIRDDTNAPPKPKPRIRPKLDESIFQKSRVSSSVRRSNKEKSEDITDETARAPVLKTRPSIMRPPSDESDLDERRGRVEDREKQNKAEVTRKEGREDEEDEDGPAKASKSARERAERLSRLMGSHSAPGSRYTSPQRSQKMVVRSPPASPPPDDQGRMPIDLNDLPLEKLESRRTRYGIEDDTEDDEEAEEDAEIKPRKKKKTQQFLGATARLLGHHRDEAGQKQSVVRSKPQEPRSGAQTPIYERDPDDYVPKPTEYKEGYLSSLLKLYDQEGLGSAISHIPSGPGGAARAAKRSASAVSLLRPPDDGAADTPGQTPVTTPGGSPASSGASTPKPKHQKWYYKNPASQSTGALSDLVSSSTVFAQPGGSKQSSVVRPKPKHRPLSQQALKTVLGKKDEADKDSVIRVHLADLAQRHEYLLKMCRALMSYGAPTHRLEGNYCIRYHLRPVANDFRIHANVC